MFSTLHSAALQAATLSRSEYSSTKVGAAALTTDGDVIRGTNLETAAWVPGLHAETSVVAAWQMLGQPSVSHLVIVSLDPDRVLAPCGMCRQLLYEMFGGELLVWGLGSAQSSSPIETWTPLSTLLPWAFGPKDLS